MDKKNLFTLLIGTAITLSVGISEADARLFKCLSSHDSTVVTLNPLRDFQYPMADQFDHAYQPLSEDTEGLTENLPNNSQFQKGKIRNFVYRLRGKKTFHFAPGLDISGATTTSLATTGNSQFSDLPEDPDEIISSSYNVDLSEKQYKSFTKFIKQTNNSFLTEQGVILNTLLSCPPQSEE